MTKTTHERIRKLLWGPDRPDGGVYVLDSKTAVHTAERELDVAEKHAKNCRDALKIARVVERMQPC